MPELTGTAVAQALHVVALGAPVAQVRVTPVWTDASGEMRQRHVVCLIDAKGRAVGGLPAHRAALDILRRELPDADWSRPHAYVVATGVLLGATPAAPVTLAEAAEDGAL